ncbi:MAG TPA: hypothetical protein VLQ79_02880 [Myxococcaceae bacterium]|nr:hypothetical protein [Myxococcaceae bacterium]
MNLTDASMVGLVAVMAAHIGRWVARSSRPLAVGVLGARALWLAVTAGLANAGVLSAWTARPPRVPLLAVAALGAALLLGRTATFRGMVDDTPRSWPILAQTFRVPVELILFGLYASGRAPAQVTFEGRNLDILVGLTAPLVAWGVSRERAGAALAVGWNVLGLAVLANTVVTVVTSTPGPLHLDWPGAPFTAIATWPMVWLPAFLAPLAVFLHAVSLQQSASALRRAAARHAS